jgi:hypothetical protein
MTTEKSMNFSYCVGTSSLMVINAVYSCQTLLREKTKMALKNIILKKSLFPCSDFLNDGVC